MNNPNEKRLPTDPKTWWLSAHESYLAAEVLKNAGLAMPCMAACHSMIEKALKAACAEKSILEQSDARHALVMLARKVGLFDDLSAKNQANLRHLSSLREPTNYPTTEFRYEVVSNPAIAHGVYQFSTDLYVAILAKYGSESNRPEEGGSDGA